ncbi:RCC1 domain-containing protein [Chondromyces crocatus]
MEAGDVWCWGLLPNAEGGSRTVPLPERIELPLPALQVAVGGTVFTGPHGLRAHFCALLADGTVRCWGTNQLGQLGLGDTGPHEGAQIPNVNGIREIAAGTDNTCAINAQNQLYCWGPRSTGLIEGDTTPAAPTLIAESVDQVSVASFHACAVMVDRTLKCWGLDFYGSLGLGAGGPTHATTPTSVGHGSNFAEVSCGLTHTCARSSSGVSCWGNNANGQLGLGSRTNYNSPQSLNLFASQTLRAGASHTAAVIAGDVYLWGSNAFKQMGSNDAFDTLLPVRLSLPSVSRLALGERFSCALTAEGRVLCWGANDHAQLGDGTLVSRATAAPVRWR